MATDKNKPVLSDFFRSAREVAGKVCGVSLACVKKICIEAKKESEARTSSNITFKSPRKSYKCANLMTNLDDFDNEVVKKTVHTFL